MPPHLMALYPCQTMAHIAVQTAELEEEAEILNSGGILPYTPRQFPGISRGGSVTRPGTLRRTGTHKASSLSQAASPAEGGSAGSTLK